MLENYERSRALSSLTVFGEEFKISRLRGNGKPFRKYLTLVHGGVAVADAKATENDPLRAREWFSNLFAETFTSREELLTAIDGTKKRKALSN